MGRQRRVHRAVTPAFPPDFPARLERFKAASGFSWRALARRLGVSPYRLREWRRGTVPSSTHLFGLLVLAGELGLMETLLYPDRTMSKESDGTRETVGSLIVGHVRTTGSLRP